MDQKMTVLRIEPNKAPSCAEIETGLSSLQKAVGEYIEAVYPFDDPVALVVNEEGKLDGLPLNRALRDDDGHIYDVVAGTFLVVGLGESNFTSLTPELLKKYEKMFYHPEAFINMNGCLMAIPTSEPSQKNTRSIPKKRTEPER